MVSKRYQDIKWFMDDIQEWEWAQSGMIMHSYPLFGLTRLYSSFSRRSWADWSRSWDCYCVGQTLEYLQAKAPRTIVVPELTNTEDSKSPKLQKLSWEQKVYATRPCIRDLYEYRGANLINADTLYRYVTHIQWLVSHSRLMSAVLDLSTPEHHERERDRESKFVKLAKLIQNRYTHNRKSKFQFARYSGHAKAFSPAWTKQCSQHWRTYFICWTDRCLEQRGRWPSFSCTCNRCMSVTNNRYTALYL